MFWDEWITFLVHIGNRQLQSVHSSYNAFLGRHSAFHGHELTGETRIATYAPTSDWCVQCRCSASGVSRGHRQNEQRDFLQVRSDGFARVRKSSHMWKSCFPSPRLRVQRLHRPLWTIQPSAQFSPPSSCSQGSTCKATSYCPTVVYRHFERRHEDKNGNLQGNNPSPCFVSTLSVHAAWRAHHWTTDSFVQFSLGVDTQDHWQRLRHH